MSFRPARAAFVLVSPKLARYRPPAHLQSNILGPPSALRSARSNRASPIIARHSTHTGEPCLPLAAACPDAMTLASRRLDPARFLAGSPRSRLDSSRGSKSLASHTHKRLVSAEKKHTLTAPADSRDL